jgi:stage II sporulation protein GA (sporulation sigma-E factor processing peptidase)
MINFSMDFLCFFLSARILQRRLSLARTFFASVLGGLYATLALFSYASGALSLIIDVLACLIMSAVAVYGRRNSIGSTLTFALTYFLVSMLLGGIMTGVFNLLNRLSLPLGEIGNDGASVWILLILAVVSGALTLFGGDFFKKKSQIRHAQIEVKMFGKEISLSAIVDSGNLLKDPLSGKSVIVADILACSPFLPPNIVKCAKARALYLLSDLPNEYRGKIRLIPASTAVGDSVMVAIVPERVIIKDAGGFHASDALIGLSDMDGAPCGAIVPVSLVT